MLERITNSTPIAALTVGQFKELMLEIIPREKGEVKEKEKEFIYGLRGIRELFNCSHTTAHKLKNTILAPAVMQNGRKIMVDKVLALELYKTNCIR